MQKEVKIVEDSSGALTIYTVSQRWISAFSNGSQRFSDWTELYKGTNSDIARKFLEQPALIIKKSK